MRKGFVFFRKIKCFDIFGSALFFKMRLVVHMYELSLFSIWFMFMSISVTVVYTCTCAAIIDKKTPRSIKSPSWHAERLLRYLSPSNKCWPFRISLLHSLMFVLLRVFYWREFPLRQCKSDIIYVLPSLEPILVKLICCI